MKANGLRLDDALSSGRYTPENISSLEDNEVCAALNESMYVLGNEGRVRGCRRQDLEVLGRRSSVHGTLISEIIYARKKRLHQNSSMKSAIMSISSIFQR